MSGFQKVIITLAFACVIGGLGVAIWGGATADYGVATQRMVAGLGIVVVGIIFMHLGTET